MDQIKITTSEVSEIAAQIRSINNSMDDVLNSVSRLMKELSGVWVSSGAETIVERFQNFAGRFIEESEVIESYARFLDYTVSSYDSLESVITANASGFE